MSVQCPTFLLPGPGQSVTGVDGDILADKRIVVVSAAVVTLEFVVEISYAVDVTADVRFGAGMDINLSMDARMDAIVEALTVVLACAIIDVVSDIDVGLLADVNVSVVSAVVTTSEFISITASLEYSLLLCRPAVSCWRMPALDCVRALQARMPSYHV